MIIIMSGLPGTGKTSVAGELAGHLGAARLTTDELRRKIDKHPDYSKKHKRSVYAALMEEAAKKLEQGEPVILDGTFFKRDMRRRAGELARKHDESFFLVEVTCPEEVVKKRIEKRYQAGADASEADYKVYKIMGNQFEEIEHPDYVVDTRDEKAWKEKVQDIANRIRVKNRHVEIIDPLMERGGNLFQTHMSWVILDGTYARKIKKPVKYSFVDYSTLERRKRLCHREYHLNFLISPEIYLGVEPIVRENGKVAFSGEGTTLDYCVKMKELPQEDRMDHRLEKNTVSGSHIREIAWILFDFHNRSHKAEDIYAGTEAVRDNFKPVFELSELIQDKLGEEERMDMIRRNVDDFLNRRQDLFEKRKHENKVRHGHGDARTKNIFITENEVFLFDAVEFSEKIASCDVAADLAYLAMDLNFFGRNDLADTLVSRYVSLSGDSDLYKLIDFYQCYRAMVQVLVQAYLLEDEDVGRDQKKKAGELCKRYLELAGDFSKLFRAARR
ncbi:MAG: AAA family ATPase [Candidatus Aminicenantes bacterium]